ncbi:zinc finger protein ZFPM1 isoform X3 [Leopardus geoffroyi]|uniref:zinc finger protein ZFPM1 isoform X3 n=1 Tax=Leopardus geoffroyi TaxID=46844 RepID=UPI001E2641CE|nr:zinc finger protein ZFPM1 isoform X3 [Leopardus geoffroyi]
MPSPLPHRHPAPAPAGRHGIHPGHGGHQQRRLPLQRLRHLVPEREEPAGPPTLLLRQPPDHRLARCGRRREAQGDLPQRARLPLPPVPQELPQRQLPGDPHAQPQRRTALCVSHLPVGLHHQSQLRAAPQGAHRHAERCLPQLWLHLHHKGHPLQPPGDQPHGLPAGLQGGDLLPRGRTPRCQAPPSPALPFPPYPSSGLAQVGPAPALKCGPWGLPADSLASFQQHTAPPGPLASTDLGLAPTPSPGLDRKALAEATNGEARAAPQNGGSSEPAAAPRAVKTEAATEEPEAEPGPPAAASRTPSPPSPAPARVKAELSSPTPGSSPGPGELGLAAGTLFLPQFPAAPPASEILAKMSELVHSRLQAGAGAQAGLFAGAPKGATCFECDITFNNVNNFYVHKRLYCSGRRPPDDAPPARRAKAPPAPGRAPPGPPPPEADPGRASPSSGAREDEAGGAATPEAEAEAEGGGRGREGSPGSPSPGSGADEDDDPRRTLCEACNIRFSRHETYTVHKRYYCASRHDPPPRRPAPAGPPGTPAPPAPALPAAPPVRTRRRRKLYELHAAAPPPASGPAPEPPASPSPRPGSGSGPDAADGPIDLSKKPRRQAPVPAPGLPALADYHECTACRVSFHSLEAYLAHKKFSCPAAPRLLRVAAEDAAASAVVCPYCPPNGVVRGDLIEHFRLAHGLLLGQPPAGARTPSPAAPRDGLNGQELREPAPGAPDGSPRPGPPPAPSPEAVPPHPPPPPTPPSHSDKGVQTPSKGTPAPAPPGSHRYCRLCNIRFSSLSTFIAHKKYYCSSHAAEHVK